MPSQSILAISLIAMTKLLVIRGAMGAQFGPAKVETENPPIMAS
jgi:hypothetical protein